jgi:hypothetical protein
MTGLSPWLDAGGKHLAEEEDEGVRRGASMTVAGIKYLYRKVGVYKKFRSINQSI